MVEINHKSVPQRKKETVVFSRDQDFKEEGPTLDTGEKVSRGIGKRLRLIDYHIKSLIIAHLKKLLGGMGKIYS